MTLRVPAPRSVLISITAKGTVRGKQLFENIEEIKKIGRRMVDCNNTKEQTSVRVCREDDQQTSVSACIVVSTTTGGTM
jgi:recombinational DNA repair protein RecR